MADNYEKRKYDIRIKTQELIKKYYLLYDEILKLNSEYTEMLYLKYENELVDWVYTSNSDKDMIKFREVIKAFNKLEFNEEELHKEKKLK